MNQTPEDASFSKKEKCHAKTSLTRRSFLDWLLTGGIVAWAATVIIPILQYLTPLKETNDVKEVELGPDDKKKIINDGFAIIRLGGERIIVIGDTRGELRAFSAKCTHESCTVTFRSEDEIIWCACHNGRFDKFGRNISGPPPAPLKRYKISGNLNGRLMVIAEEV